jgi:hypothetical protein
LRTTNLATEDTENTEVLNPELATDFTDLHREIKIGTKEQRGKGTQRE